MIYTELTKKALQLSFEAHKDQKDKSGMPYVYHPFHLAEQMQDEQTTIVALLHDVIEDTDYSLGDIKAMGFPDEVINALALMTHDKSVPYMDYVAKIKSNPIARAVKLADLRHNSDLSRVNTVDGKAIKRVQKYAEAIKLLTDSEERTCNLSFTCYAQRYICLSGDIFDGCLSLTSEVYGDNYDSEGHYTLSEKETEKLFSLLNLNEIIELSQRGNLSGLLAFMDSHGITYDTTVI